MSSEHHTNLLLRKLQSRSELNDADIAAIRKLPTTPRTYEAPGYIVREGMSAPRNCSLILSGFSVRQKLTADGHRQIVGINLPGDLVDLQHLFLMQADHNVQALTRVEAVDIDRMALQDIALRHPNISRALWIESLIEASIHREWILNIGRRDARKRVAHLLCEFAVRMAAAGLEKGSGGYELPMTQEQLGDAVGLTSVHINRTLKSLAAEGVMQRDRRHISFMDWEKIRAVGDFSALYLHLDQKAFDALPSPIE